MGKHCDFALQKLRSNLPLAFFQVTPNKCQKLIAMTATEENKYWEEDGEIDKNQEVDVDKFKKRNLFPEDVISSHVAYAIAFKKKILVFAMPLTVLYRNQKVEVFHSSCPGI